MKDYLHSTSTSNKEKLNNEHFKIRFENRYY